MRTHLGLAIAVFVLIGGDEATVFLEGQDSLVLGEQVDALRCWRNVNRKAVRVGESFAMTLTCSVVETRNARTMPDLARLAPENIDVRPFEVVDGTRFEDIVEGVRRFFQFRYVIRISGEEYFGRDVELPALELMYRIERWLEGGPVFPGRELTYILPVELIKVLSLVPEDADDIRELQSMSFGEAESRLFRANVAVIVSAVLGMLALGVLIAGVVRVRSGRDDIRLRGERVVPASAVARSIAAGLRTVQCESETEGWSRELAGRALLAFRLLGAVATGRPVAQDAFGPTRKLREGELRVQWGLWRRTSTVVSSAVTAAVVSVPWRLEGVDPESPMRTAQRERLREGLVLFTAARYGESELQTDALTVELDYAIAVAQRLRFQALGPVRWTQRMLTLTWARWRGGWGY